MKTLVLLICSVVFSTTLFANITQSKWRWRNDDGNEKTATWKAAENTATTVNDFNSFRLRLSIYNANADVKTFSRNLQYATSASGPWYTLSDASPIQAFVISSSGFMNNAQATTQQLTASQYGFTAGSTITDADVYNDNIQPSTSSEYEWCLKATANAQPQTTYYFKAAEGDAPARLPSITTGSAFTAKKIILSNGSFEQNATGWQTAARNGSQANFTVVKSTAHSGANAFKATVTSLAKYNSTGIGHAPFKVTKEGYYLLRFWAVADVRNALLTLNIKTSKGNDTCFFKIYDRFDKTANQWQMYQYAFKAPAGNVTVQMGLNTATTYYIDDVEVLDESATEDVVTQYNWQNNHSGYGWLSGDNDNSVLLPDSSVAWIFSDSFMGLPLPHSNVLNGNAPIINNLVVHEENNQYSSVYKGSAGSPQSLFSPGNGNIFWNSGGTVEGNNLRVMLIEIAGGGTYNNSAYVGTLSLPDLKFTGQVKTSYTGPNSPNTVFTDGNYHYIYISERVGTFENYSQVARVPVGSLSSATTQWQFYTNNNTWSTSYANAKRIVAGVEAASVVKLGTNNYALTGVPNLSNEVAVWFAQSPVGPWINKTVLYYIPVEEGMLPYQGHIDKGSGKNGIYTLSYSVYPFSGYVPQQIADKGSYIPYYIKANLAALSPFTSAAKQAKESAVAKEDISKLPAVVLLRNPVTKSGVQFRVNNIKGAFTAALTDINGKRVTAQQFKGESSTVYHLNMESVSAGTYILNVTQGKISVTTKVIVQ